MSQIVAEVRPRLHLGLISMHQGGARRNGGIGFAIEAPGVSLRFAPSERFLCDDRRARPLNDTESRQLGEVMEAAQRAYSLPTCVSVFIEGAMPTHCGFGSGTGIRLACLEGLFAINGRELEQPEIISLSGRGGTSGIGINTYFHGGLVLDLGVGAGSDAQFLPSSSAVVHRMPLTLGRIDFPDWTIGLCIPRACRPKTQAEELDFFRRSTPLPQAASFEAAYHAVFGLYAAVAEADYGAFCQAVDVMQTTRWKQLERLEYGDDLERADRFLRSKGADCVGMSSLGPLLFFLASDHDLRRIQETADANGCDVMIVKPSNRGRTMRPYGP